MRSTGSAEPGGGRTAAVLAAGAAGWEPAALELLAASSRRVVLVKRCLDLADLLATASTGTVQVAVVSDQLAGLDGDSVDRLARHGVRTIVVTGDDDAQRPDPAARARLVRLGVSRVLDAAALDDLVTLLTETPGASEVEPLREPAGEDLTVGPAASAMGDRAAVGRLVTVWGPGGGPGRTTLALGLAAEAAARGRATMLLDADPYGGTAGSHLAVLDEVSGLLAAARLANAGQLDPVALAALAREVGPRLRLLTGLPRPDRWTDVRGQAFAELVAVARRLDDLVVVDTGPTLPSASRDPFATAPARDEMTVTAVEAADQVVVVGSADPVGLTRLARALPELLEHRPDGELQVVVNRMRPSLGWSEKEVRYLVEGVAPRAHVAFLPDDVAAADRALVSGRTLLEGGESALRRAVAAVADLVLGPTGAEGSPAGRGRLRR